MRLCIITIFVLLNQSSWPQTNHKQISIEKATPKEGNYIEVPCSFSDETIFKSNSLDKLQSKKIKCIELIYTQFKENPNFDQVRLNENRMRQLNQLLPKLGTDHPEIIWIEQTGATTREEAVSYFHGFRIYTDDESLKDLFIRLLKDTKSTPTSMFTIDNSVGGNFSHPSGTQIHIPADAVVFKNGKRVTGTYTFSYREYLDVDSTVFSGMSTTYQDKTGYYQFTSPGMFEIRGTKEGEYLRFQKEIVVDF